MINKKKYSKNNFHFYNDERKLLQPKPDTSRWGSTVYENNDFSKSEVYNVIFDLLLNVWKLWWFLFFWHFRIPHQWVNVFGKFIMYIVHSQIEAKETTCTMYIGAKFLFFFSPRTSRWLSICFSSILFFIRWVHWLQNIFEWLPLATARGESIFYDNFFFVFCTSLYRHFPLTN